MDERPKRGLCIFFSEFLLGQLLLFLPLNGIQVSSMIQSLAANLDRLWCGFERVKCLSSVFFQTLEADIIWVCSRLFSKVSAHPC